MFVALFMMSLGMMIIVMLVAAVFGYPLSFLFECIAFKMNISDTGLQFIASIAGVMMTASGLFMFFSGFLMMTPSYENLALMIRCLLGSLFALIICMAVLFACDERYESMLNETDDVDDEPVGSAYVEDGTDLSESLFPDLKERDIIDHE